MSLALTQALNRVKSSRLAWRKSDPNNLAEVKQAYGIYRENVKAYKVMKVYDKRSVKNG